MVIIFLLVAGVQSPGQEPAPPQAEEDSAILIRSTPIEGKVFLLTVDRGEEEIPGGNVMVTVRHRKKREMVYQTKTRKDGSYDLPKLEPREYYLFMGELELNLKVFPESIDRTDLSKVLIVMIPEEMAGDGAARGK